MAIGKKIAINSTRIELISAGGEKTNVFFDIESANNPRAVAASKDADLDALFAANIKDSRIKSLSFFNRREHPVHQLFI